MAKKMNLFYILKLNVSTILEHNYNISISLENAKDKGWIVSIGDNQILKFIRDIKCIDFDKQICKINELYELRNNLKSQLKSPENSRKIYEYQKQIDKLLYVPDIVLVHANTTKKDYDKVAKNTFVVNGIVFKRLCAGAGQLRRNTVIFVNESLYDELEKIMMCGLDKKRIGKINLAKFSAYYSLYSSSTNIISKPRVCVVKDYEMPMKNQLVEWIYTKENGERDIETRSIDFEQKVWDGQGLVSVEMAKQWNKDLGIDDYCPSAYIIRSAWIKGLCVVFDWKRFAKDVARKEFITDAWGHKKHIDEIDVILTTSQFKMWKKYKNWEEYLHYHNKYGHVWGCSRVNKKKDNYLTTLNYQYIQSNNFTSESIKKLADFSIDWVKKVCTGDRLYVLLYLLGCHESDKNLKDVESVAGMNIVKALIYDENILNDSYVRNRIYKSIQKKIDQMKIGKILVEGSYEFAIVDPYMFCEYVFGLELKGLLKAGQLWQKRWVDKKSKEVALMRSPLVSPNENQILEVYNDKKCEDWFFTIKSGVILNGWDTTLMRASDGDCDGDLLITTDNEYLVRAVDRSLKPITYEKSTTREQFLTYNNLAKMDTKSFNTKIGFITNLATSFICLRNTYNEDDDEYKELTKRINLLRFHQGSAIDAGKGNLYIPPPKHWSRKVKIDWEKDSDEVKKKKLYINKLVGNKKSYFMCYIYPALMKNYKQYKKSYNRICKAMFGCKIDNLLKKKNKTKEENKFIRNYYKYLPVLMNRSIMNELAWYIEGIDFDLRFFKTDSDFDYTILMNDNIKVDADSIMYEKILSCLKKYHSVYELNTNEMKFIEEHYDFSEEDDHINHEYSILFKKIENELFSICSNRYELCNYVVHIMYNCLKNKSKAIMWNVCGKEIVDNLKEKNKTAYFPIRTSKEEGEEYLGKYYKLQEVEIVNI